MWRVDVRMEHHRLLLSAEQGRLVERAEDRSMCGNHLLASGHLPRRTGGRALDKFVSAVLLHKGKTFGVFTVLQARGGVLVTDNTTSLYSTRTVGPARSVVDARVTELLLFR